MAARMRSASEQRARTINSGIVAACGVVGGLICSYYKNGHFGLDRSHILGTGEVYDAVILGGGVVGLSVAQSAALRGYKVALIEKEGQIGSSPATAGNSGLGCTGYDAPTNSLERQLLLNSIALHAPLYRHMGLSLEHVRKCGSLVVAWSKDELNGLVEVVEQNKSIGDQDVVILNQKELLKQEPSLSPDAVGAVFCPHESISESFLVPVAYAESAVANGAKLAVATKAVGFSYNDRTKLWAIETESISPIPDIEVGRSQPGEILVQRPSDHKATNSGEVIRSMLTAKAVINCTGLYGDQIEQLRKNRLPHHSDNIEGSFEIQPRKGQFVVFRPTNDTHSPKHIIEPVPTQFTKGVIIWQTLHGHIITGPTADPQTSRNDRSTDKDTVEKLVKWAHEKVPSLKNAEVVGSYSGIRPATQHRDYQITADTQNQWICVGGIRSTGLSASAGIGHYVTNLLQDIVPLKNPKCPPLLTRDASDVADAMAQQEEVHNVLANSPIVTLDPIESLEELAKSYSEDGSVTLCGKKYVVSHPISAFGFSENSGDKKKNKKE